MGAVENIITDNLPIWSSSVQSKSSSGRGTSSKRTLYGVKKLRELILDLAVRGLLVPQDPNDEPASVLIEKVVTERRHLIASGVIKKSRRLANQLENSSFNLPLPESWCWVSLAEIGHDWGQKVPDNEFTYIEVGAINKDRGLIQDYNILDPESAPSRARKLVKKGSVIYSTVRPYLLNIAVIQSDINPEPIASTAFAVIHPLGGISSSYVSNYLRSNIFIQYVESCQTGIAYPAINDKQFFSGLIALPPLAEQYRIAAKVDELMALCDTLEQQQEDSIQAHEVLVEALLEALTDAIDADTFQAAWQRISEHFDVLFTTEHSIDKLKETILQLAVMGKLVPQDPNDEPASMLLERIVTEKQKLIKEGKIKGQKIFKETGGIEKPFFMPNGWTYGYIPQVVKHDKHAIKRGPFGSAIKKSFFVDKGYKVYEQQHAIRDDFSIGEYYINDEKFKELKVFEVKPNDIIISCSGTVGRVAIAPVGMEAGIINQALLKISLNQNGLTNNYFKILFPAFYMQTETLSDLKGTAQKNMVSVDILKKEPFPLPPLAEQHRIVAKVDELMALCDQLKESLQQAQQTQVHLTDAVVENAL